MNNERGMTLSGFLLRLLLIIVLVILLAWIMPMPNLTTFYSSVFSDNLSKMKEAATTYYTNERLPQIEGESTKMTLQEMIDENLLLPFLDEKGKQCNTESSYVEITKEGSEYVMKVYLSCDEQKDFIKVHMGCYNKCTDGSCGKKCTTLYEYKKATTGTKKVAYCAKGYTLKNGKCYKSLSTTDIIDATKNTAASTYKCSNGTSPVNGTCTTELAVVKRLIPARQESYIAIEKEYYKCNCKTQTVNTCASVSGCYNYVTKTVCSTCSRNVEVTKYKTIPASTDYSCPAGTTRKTGDKETLKCFKDEKATEVPGEVTYSCPTDYTLKDTKCVKEVLSKTSIKANYKNQKYTSIKYTWSDKTILDDWTKTGKTKQSCK